MAALIAAATVAWGTSWMDFSLARARLAMLRRTPWRLMTFLDDARHLGVLRQVGPVYQFRHTRLREQLAQRCSGLAPANRPTPRLADSQEQVDTRSSVGPARPAALRALAHVALAAAVLGAAALARAYLVQPGHPADPALQAITARPPIYDNSLRHNDGAWYESDKCKFENAAYHVREDLRFYHYCWGPKLSPDDPGAAAFRVRMTINNGNGGGIALFSDGQVQCLYDVKPTGAYELDSEDPRTSDLTTVQFGFSLAVRTGLGKENTLAVVAQTNTTSFYVNDVFILSTDHCGSGHREIGLSAAAATAPADVEFAHAQGWQT